MPLKTCPDCSNEVSDRAETCPHCGYPLARARAESRAAKIGSTPEWESAKGDAE